MYADSEYGYAFRARQNLRRFGHRIYYNAEGLRSEELGGRPRILCIGDSVTNGGVPTDQSETYPYRLEEYLRADGRNYQVLNASAGSWSAENELAWLLKRGAFGAGTIIIQIGTHDLWQRKSTGDVVGRSVNFPSVRPLTAIGEAITRYVVPQFGRGRAAPSGGELRRVDHIAAMNAVEGMLDFAKRSGIRAVVLHTPNREEVIAGRHARDEWRELKGMCDRRKVRFVDVMEDLTLSHRKGAIVFRDGVHLNGAGDIVVARRLERCVSRELNN